MPEGGPDQSASRHERELMATPPDRQTPPSPWPARDFFAEIQTRLDARAPGPDGDFFHHYGLTVLGPVYCAFLLGLVDRVKETRPSEIYFLARDGYLFEKMYARWRELEGRAEAWPMPRYLYVSRRVTAAALVADGLSLAQAAIAFQNPRQQGLLSVLKAYGLPAASFGDLGRRHGLTDLAEPLADTNDPRLQGFLADEEAQSAIRVFGKAARHRLDCYLRSEGFFSGGRAVLVDVGWNATIQSHLNAYFGGQPDYPEVHGCYFGYLGGDREGGGAEGLMLDLRRRDSYEWAAMEFEELIEQTGRSPEGTTVDYALDGDDVKPVLKDSAAPDRLAEIECNPLIARLQEGILEHLEYFHAVWRRTGCGFADLKPYVLALLERALVYPTREEVAEIGKLAHSEDLGNDGFLSLATDPVGVFALLRPRRLGARLRSIPWKYAAFAGSAGGLAAWLFRVAALRRRRARISK